MASLYFIVCQKFGFDAQFVELKAVPFKVDDCLVAFHCVDS